MGAAHWHWVALATMILAIVFLLNSALPTATEASRKIIVATLIDPSRTHGHLMEELMAIGDRINVEVTAYSSESPETGTITASGQKVRRGIIAVSRDLEKECGLKFGDLVEIEGVGTFEVQDRMNKRWRRRVDIWYPTEKECFTFGKQNRVLIILGKDGTDERASCEGSSPYLA